MAFSASQCSLTLTQFQANPDLLVSGECPCGQPLELHPMGAYVPPPELSESINKDSMDAKVEKVSEIVDSAVKYENHTGQTMTITVCDVAGRSVLVTSGKSFRDAIKKCSVGNLLPSDYLSSGSVIHDNTSDYMINIPKRISYHCINTLNESDIEQEKSEGINMKKLVAFTSYSHRGVPLPLTHPQADCLTFTGRADVTSLARPMQMDIKDHLDDLLTSLMVRLQDNRLCYQHISNHIMIGMTMTEAYLFKYDRTWSRPASDPCASKVMIEALIISKFPFKDVSRVWAELTAEAVHDPSVYRGPDYVIIHRVLQYFTEVPGFCRVVAVGSSTCRVYTITFFQWRPHDQTVSESCAAVTLGTNLDDLQAGYSVKAHLTVKVSNERYLFLSESLCLGTVADALNDDLQDPQVAVDFNALGFMDCSSDHPKSVPVFFNKKWDAHYKHIRQELSTLLSESVSEKRVALQKYGWWHERPNDRDIEGGAIFLRLAKNGSNKLSYMKHHKSVIREQTQRWLCKYIFDANIIHRDLRHANVMEFEQQHLSFSRFLDESAPPQPIAFVAGSGWQLIDASVAGYRPPTGRHSHSPPTRKRVYGDCGTDTSDGGLPVEDIFVSVRNHLEEPRLIEKLSQQYVKAGLDVRMIGQYTLGLDFYHMWTASDDFAMWEGMINSIPNVS